MFHHPIMFPATKGNKVAIQKARELINVVYPIQASGNESVNEERKQLLTRLNSLDGRLLAFQEKKDLEALTNQLKLRVTGMKPISVFSNNTVSGNGSQQARDVFCVGTQHNHVTVLGQPVSCSVEKLSETLKQKYLGFKEIKGLFGRLFALEREYINLQMICHTEVEEEKNQCKEKKLTNNGRLSSYEDLFGDKRVIKPEDLFKSDHDLFPNVIKKNSATPTLLLIQGRAGIGKTTFLHYVSREWAEGKLYSQYRWVFKLTCRELRSELFQKAEELKIWEWVYHSQFSASDISKQGFEELWGNLTQSDSWQKEVLFCIDGYDELPERHPCKKALEILLRGEYAGIHKIITSRPYGVAELPKERRDIEAIGFTDENISRYLQTYFPSGMRAMPSSPSSSSFSLAMQLRDSLKQNPILWGIAHIPVNLNLICGIMERMQKKDLQRKVGALGSLSQLYQAMEEKLLERIYERDKETKSLKSLSTIPERRRPALLKHYQKACCFLARLAFEGMQESQIILSRPLLNQVLEAQQIEDDRELLLQLQEIGFIKSILESATAEDEQDYEFIHLTFQEYYAAKHIVAEIQADQAQRDQMKPLIMKERYNPRWQIVWWFVAGLLCQNNETYTEYIRLLQGQNTKEFLTGDLLQHYGLGLLARCLDEGLATNKNILPVMDKSITLLQASVKSLYLCVQIRDMKISSALIESLRLSPRLLLLPDKKDLYSQIDLGDDTSYVKGSIRSIGQIRIATPKVLGYLAKQLANPSRTIRQRAAYAVCGIGSAAATPGILGKLVNLLGDENDNSGRKRAAYGVNSVRRSAVDAIRSIGSAAATPGFLVQLAKLLSNENDGVRRSAAQAVSSIGSKAATSNFLAQFVSLLIDENYKVRRSAAEAIRGIGSKAAIPDFLAQLAKWLSDEKDDVRWHAAAAICRIGPVAATPEILAQLVKLLSDKDDKVRRSAAAAVRGIGSKAATPEILAQLAKWLGDENDDNNMCCNAAAAVRGIGSAAATPEILGKLANLLSDDRYYVRRSAAEAVRSIGSKAATPEVLAQLANLLSDENDDMRRSAAEAIRGIGSKAAIPAILAQLAKLLSDGNHNVRWSAVNAVGGIGSAAATPEILGKLANLLSDDTYYVRWSTAEAVCSIGSKAAIPEILAQLAKLLGDENDYARERAAKAVSSIGSAAATPEILGKLANLLSDDKYYVCWSTAEAIHCIGSAAVTSDFLAQFAKLLSDENNDVRERAAKAVSSIGSKAATPEVLAQLANLLSDENDDVRRSAAYAVRDIGPEAATPAILGKLVSLLRDENYRVRWSAAGAVSSIGSAAATPAVLAQLAKLLSDENAHVRRSAADAISNIGSEVAKPEIFNQLVKLMLTGSPKYWDYVIPVLPTLIPAIFTDNLQQWAKQPADLSPSDTVDINLISTIIGAYLTGHISCQVDGDAGQQQYMVSGFVHIQGYSIPINEQQAQWLCQTVPEIIEQLSQRNISNVLLASKLNTNYNLDPHPSNSSHISQQNNLYSNKEQANTLFGKTKKRKYAHISIGAINQENYHRELKLLPKASEEALPTVSATSIPQALFSPSSPPPLTGTDRDLVKKAKDILDREYPETDANNNEDIKIYREEKLSFLNGFKKRLTKADKDKINDLIKELGEEELSHEMSLG